jgi:hypothetical protein
VNDAAPKTANEGKAISLSTEYRDPVIEAYKKDVDRTLLRENLKLSVEERVRKAENIHRSIEQWRGAARRKPQGDDSEHRE